MMSIRKAPRIVIFQGSGNRCFRPSRDRSTPNEASAAASPLDVTFPLGVCLRISDYTMTQSVPMMLVGHAAFDHVHHVE